MPVNAKWPDFRLASTLRSLIGSQPSEPERPDAPSSPLSDHPEHPQHPQPFGRRDSYAHEGQAAGQAVSAMADPQAPMPHGLEGFQSDAEDGQMTGADVDFGPLEMFDSNATDPPFSSQANPVAPFPSAGQAPEAVMSEDMMPPPSSKKSKRDKKGKKNASRHAELPLPLPDDDGEKKHKNSKRKAAVQQDLDAPDAPWHNDAAADKGEAPPSATLAEAGAVQSTEANLELNGNDDAVVPSTRSKKKRKLSDSTDGKRRKKHRSREPTQTDDIGDAGAAEAVASAAVSSRRGKEKRMPLEGAIEEEGNAPESDPQKSPAVAHLERRSQSREARSRENSIPSRPDADRMDVDPETEETGATAADDDMEDEADVEALAREAWQEHRNGQNALVGGQDTAGTPPPATQPPAASPRRTRSTRKKSKPTFFEQPPVEESAAGAEASHEALAEELPSPAAMTPKPRNRAKAVAKKARGKRQPREKLSQSMRSGSEEFTGGEESRQPRRNRLIGYTQGRFSDNELARIARAVEGFRIENGLTQQQVNEMIHAPGGTTAGDAHAQLWLRIFAECPDRHRQKVINITRKKFHNFIARGTWTMDQDTELSELIGVHGTKWSKIAAIINRHPEDLRDRYRNYLVCGENQRKDAWDEAEEARLTQYVIDAMETIDDLRQSEPNHQLMSRSYEELIDWQNISERTGRTRSRLQCITKWKSLNIRINGKDKLVSGAPDAQISFGLEKARLQIAAMPEEEKFRMVLAIQATAVGKDAKIPWHRLVDKQFRTQWHRPTQMLLWRRLRQSVPDGQTQTTRDCAQYLVDEYNRTGGLPEVAVDGYDNEGEMEFVQNIPSSSMAASGTPGRAGKSAEFVADSDAEENEAATNGNADEATAEDRVGEEDLKIDPALTQTAMPTKKIARRTGSGKTPSRKKSTKAPTANMDPIEDDDESRQQQAADLEGAGSEIDEEQYRKKRTPNKFTSPGNNRYGEQGSSPTNARSESAIDDMEDLPARVGA